MTVSETYDSIDGIAIIGMSGRFPRARNLAEFWQNLRNGVEAVSFFSDQELEDAGVDPSLLDNPQYVKAGAILDDADLFDASFFGFNPREIEFMDPQHRIFLECAWEAFEDAGYEPGVYDGSIGVYAGCSMNTYLLNNLMPNRRLMESFGGFQTMIGNDKDFLATRLSYKLNLKGPSINIQSACSTSLVAVQIACHSLLSYQCDMALAGGSSIGTPLKRGYLYQEGMILSPDGHCRAFDSEAQGTVLGDGVGIVILKRLAEAIEDGDNIYAVIKGAAINNDGFSKIGYTAPSVDGQAEVIAMAQALAGIEAETVSYVETHGTGTPLGDPIEIAALTQAFRAGTEKNGFCAIGSVKTNIGHLDAAAGIASLIKTILALKHKLLPPSLHFKEPNSKLNLEESPFYVNATLSEWKRGETPRRAGVSSFGIGGTNAHVILEEYPEAVDSSGASRPWNLLFLSSKTASALSIATEKMVDYLKTNPHIDIADVAHTLQVGRKVFSHRRMVVCRDQSDGVNALETLDPQRVFTAEEVTEDRSVVFMFTGQGSQYINMGLELYQTESAFRKHVDLCADLLKPHLGIDLSSVIYPREEDVEGATQRLKQTSIAQPALFAIEYSLANLWIEWGIRPQAMIGHSIGEYVAACLAGVVSLEDALALVATRARLMQDQPGGSMLAIPLSEAEACPLLGETLSLAAVNGPSLCVASGPTEAVDELENNLDRQGVNCRRLHTSHAFHSKMMVPVLEPFTEQVKRVDLKPPEIPFVSNVTGTWITPEEATNPSYWARHLRQTVRFMEGMHELMQDADRVLLEVGPGRTLCSLTEIQPGKSSRHVALPSLRHPHDRKSDSAFLLNTLGRLWLIGVKIDWSGFYTREERHRISLPTYPFERRRYWIEPQKVVYDDAPSKPEKPSRVSLRKRPDIADWLYTPTWKQCEPAKSSGQADLAEQKLCWLAFVDECGLAEGIVKKLERTGHEVIRVAIGNQFIKVPDGGYIINPQERKDYDALLRELHALGKVPAVILHSWSISPNECSMTGIEGLERSLSLGFYSLVFLAQALEAQEFTDPIQIEVISNNLYEVDGEEALCPEKATILGPCKVIPQEYPNISCFSIDIVLPKSGDGEEQNLIDHLVAELIANTIGNGAAPEPIIAYRGDRKWVQSYKAIQDSGGFEGATRLREGGVYLITGGLGNVGMVLAEYLVRTLRAKLILTGLSKLPPKQEWDQWPEIEDETISPAERDRVSRKIRKIQFLEELGAEVLVMNADVANEDQMQAVVDRAYERYGHVHGVIHAAANVGEQFIRAIRELDQAACEQQFDPNVRGLFVLEKVLRGRAIDFCLITSSLSSVIGGSGFCAYSAANLFMDAFASRQKRINGVPWLSVNWDTWQFWEETPQVLESRVALVELGLTPTEGTEIFKRVLSMDNVTQVIVSTRELESRLESWIKRASLHEREASKSAVSPLLHARPNVATAFVAPGSALERTIADVWQEYLGIDQVGIHDNFFDLGGHSLLATQVVAKLEKVLGVRINPAEVIYNTLGQLASNCEEQLDLSGPVQKPEYKPVQISQEVREPFYFGTPEKPIFGCYHEPQSGRTKDCGIVLCYPMGQEYIKCHRTYLQLAVRLSRVGFPVLRFDYYGTGDSSGDCEQGNSRQWIADIFAAIEEFKRRSGLSKVCLVGLRLGGTLSMIAGAERSDVDSLVLCDPIVYGDAYISELHKLHKQMLRVSYVEIKHHTKGENPTEILGFPMHDFMFADLAKIDLIKIRKKPSSNMLLIQSGIDTSVEHLRDHLLSFETQLTCQQVSSPKIWLEEAFKGLVPHQLLDSVVSWLLEVYK